VAALYRKAGARLAREKKKLMGKINTMKRKEIQHRGKIL